MVPIIFGLLLGQSARPWSVNENHALVWNGKPYIPVGVRIEGTPDAVGQAQAAGVTDVLVELPADGSTWAKVISKLDEKGTRYMICLTSSSPQALVWAIEPQGYRVPGIEGVFDFRIAFPDATNVLCVLANSRDADIRWKRMLQVTEGKIRVADPQGPTTPHVLLMYPQLRDMRIPDYWEGFDAHRDQLLKLVSSLKFGKNFRGFIDPMGKSGQYSSEKATFVPMSSIFKVELETYITQKYGAVPTALRAWGFSVATLDSFKELSRVVPLWADRKGVPGFYDPETSQIYSVSEKNSSYWADVQAVIRATAARRYRRLVESLQKVVDVPFIEDWKGWDGPYTRTNPSVSGIGIEINEDSLIELVDTASYPMSAVLDRPIGSFALATDVHMSQTVDSAWAALAGAGVRGVFFRALTWEDEKKIAALAASRTDDATLSAWAPKPFLYPESARNPAAPSQLPGGYSWLPSNYPGQKIHFGYGIEGYRLEAPGGGMVVYWSTDKAKRVHFKMQDPKGAVFESLEGIDLQPKIDKKKELEITIPLSPIVYHGTSVPVPSESFAASALLVQSMIRIFPKMADFSGTESLALKDTMNGFERDPFPAFMALRQQYERMVVRAAPYKWIEAERTTSQTMSAVEDVAGCSGGRVLTLDTKLPPLLMGYKAQYTFTMLDNGVREVWLAARIPKSQRSSLRISLPGQMKSLDEPPVSFYGQGFAWYKVGEFDVSRKQQLMTIECLSTSGASFSLDAIVIGRPGFRPDGINLPEEFVAEELRRVPLKKGSNEGGPPPSTSAPGPRKE